MESVYLETTVISYLVSAPSRDLLVAAHQQTTYDWWTHRRQAFECFVSQIVIDEATAGDTQETGKKMTAIRDIQILEVTDEAERLANAIVASGALSRRSVRDAAHVAVAAVNLVDYVLTWNCAHLANAQIIRKIAVVCNREGHGMPVICTPEELMGE